MKGRKPTPAAVRKMTGTGHRTKAQINDREPIPPDGVPEPPTQLTSEARAEWFRVCADLAAMRTLTKSDRAAIAIFCQAWADWLEAREWIAIQGAVIERGEGTCKNPWVSVANEAHEQLRRLACEFGLTPSSRSRVKVPQRAESEFEKFLAPETPRAAG